MTTVLSVFVSHTRDMAEFPAPGKSFVSAAQEAILMAGCRPVEMEHFAAAGQSPADYCRHQVEACQAYIGIIGFRYGSLVPDLAEQISYTDLEFRTATRLGIPRILFLLDEQTPIPRVLIDRDPDAVDAFRDRLHTAGVVLKTIRTAEGLQALVVQALNELRFQPREPRPAAPPGPTHDARAGLGARAELGATRRLYLGRLVQRYHMVDREAVLPTAMLPTAMLPTERDRYPAVSLGSAFVPQTVWPEAPALELPKERRLLAAGEFGAGPRTDVFEAVTTARNRLVVLLGDPGSGKSMLARHLALSLADAPGVEPLAGLAGWLPLLVELRAFADLRRDFPTFLSFLGRLNDTDGLGLPADQLDDFLSRDGRALAIFDGLDEIFDPKEREAVSRQIAGFTERYPKVRVVVTSRSIGYRRSILEAAGFAHFTIQDLDDDQIGQFIERWQLEAPGKEKGGAGASRAGIQASFARSPSIRELAGNPLLLTILLATGLLATGRRREPPRERGEVYSLAASVLMEQWDAGRHLRSSAGLLAHLDGKDKKELLRRLAWRMRTGPVGLAGNRLRGEDVIAEFATCLRGRYELAPAAATATARAVVDQLRERDFILSRVGGQVYGGEVYGFVHRAFLEFFCAEDIVRRFQDDREWTPGELVADVLGPHWSDGSWDEVLLLVAGAIPAEVAGGLVGYLLRTADPFWQPGHDALPKNISLAYRCLGEIRNSAAAAPLDRALTDTLTVLLESAAQSFIYDADQAFDDVLSVVESVGHRWPGRARYLGWFLIRGSRLVPAGPHSVAAVARRIAVALLPGNEALHRQARAQALQDPDPTLRQEASRALAAGWPGDPATLALLRDRGARDEHGTVRRVAVLEIAAGWRDDPDTLPWLRGRVTHDTDRSVRAAALEAIAAGWPDDPDTRALLRDRATADAYGAVRRVALQAIATSWPDDPDTRALLRGHATADTDPAVRGVAVQAIATRWPDDPGTAALLRDRATHDIDGAVRLAAVQVIARGWRADPETIALLRDRATADGRGAVRQAAVRAIATGWPDDPSTTMLLRERAIHDTDGAVRQTAVRAVATARHHEPGARSWLRDRATRDTDAAVRRVAVQAIATDRAGEADTPGWLRDRATTDDDPAVRQAALHAVATGWPTDPATLTWLRDRATTDDDPAVRQAGLRAVLTGWRASPAILPWLRDRAGLDRDAAVRQAAAEAIATGWPDAPDTLRWLREQAGQDRDAAVRQAAAEAIATGWPDHPDTLPWLREQATADDSWTVRRAALEAIAIGWPDHPDTLPWLRGLTAAASYGADARQAAAQILRCLEGPT
jgi:Domain of unknown function (DUF4062)/HEAT repeats/NACHT domain